MDIAKIKRDYDIFTRDESLIYLDSCATSLTPRPVVAKILEYYNSYNANVARGAYRNSTKATQEYELSRKSVANFIYSDSSDEIVFTSGTTASLNTIAYGLLGSIKKNHNIVTTAMEHHANFVPWQQLSLKTGADFRVIPLKKDGTINIDKLLDNIDENTKILALTFVSNVLGTINPIAEITQKVRKKNPNTLIIVDAAQAVSHLLVDVQKLDCDYLAFSMHKLFGPTGVGILYGKKEKLELLEPLFTGGEMIEEVTDTCTTFADVPQKLEAGTPNIAGVTASREAIDYMNGFLLREIRAHEKELMQYCIDSFQEEFGDTIKIYGPKDIEKRSGAISFTFKNHHPHDIATILDDKMNIAIRAGQHCAMPLHTDVLGINATARASFSVYNEKEDIDKLIEGLKMVDKTLS